MARARAMRASRAGAPSTCENEVVLRQRDDQAGIVTRAQSLDRAPRADLSGRMRAEDFVLLGIGRRGHRALP